MTLINFPRKQIGKMMSDCLVVGVLPSGDGGVSVGDEEKRARTVYVRPFVFPKTENGKGGIEVELGARVGVLGEDGVVERNTRDLTWAEFSMVRIVVGRVLSCATSVESTSVESTTTPAIPVGVRLRLDLGPSEGERDGVVYLRIGSEGCVRPEVLVGRQVLAVVNIESDAGEGVMVLTVGGRTTVEPAKEVENGFRLA
jgi:hypothetical protein